MFTFHMPILHGMGVNSHGIFLRSFPTCGYLDAKFLYYQDGKQIRKYCVVLASPLITQLPGSRPRTHFSTAGLHPFPSASLSYLSYPGMASTIFCALTSVSILLARFFSRLPLFSNMIHLVRESHLSTVLAWLSCVPQML